MMPLAKTMKDSNAEGDAVIADADWDIFIKLCKAYKSIGLSDTSFNKSKATEFKEIIDKALQ